MAAFVFGTEKSHENFVRIDNVLAEISLIRKSLDPSFSVIQDWKSLQSVIVSKYDMSHPAVISEQEREDQLS
jgi:hypothetical protein